MNKSKYGYNKSKSFNDKIAVFQGKNQDSKNTLDIAKQSQMKKSNEYINKIINENKIEETNEKEEMNFNLMLNKAKSNQ